MSFKIIIGTASLSGNYGSVPKQEIIDTLNYCYENNFREFDTAPNYGQGVMESYLGDIFLKSLEPTEDRNFIFFKATFFGLNL